jgi:hypothetical protein
MILTAQNPEPIRWREKPTGGGGGTDHATLSNLSWTLSGHTGTASRLAGFSGAGAATYYQIGVDVQAYDAGLASFTGVDTAADRYGYTTAANTWASGTITAAGRAILDDADATAQRATLGLTIGTHVQAWDTDLDAYAALATTGIVARTGAGTVATRTITGTASQVTVTNGDGVAGAPTLAIASDPVLPGTGSVTVPVGTTAQRPGAPAVGMIRWNTTVPRLEHWDGSAWSAFGGVSAHTALSALAWTSSGHTGTASTIAAFSGAGAAAVLTPTTDELRIAGGTDLGIALNAILPGTGSVTVPSGSTAQRPGSPTAGMIRWNASIVDLEYYDTGTADWRQVANDSDINSAIGQAAIGDAAVLVYSWARQSFGWF